MFPRCPARVSFCPDNYDGIVERFQDLEVRKSVEVNPEMIASREEKSEKPIRMSR